MVTKEWGEFAYAPPSARVGQTIVLASDEAHHVFRVRRLAPGSELFVTDGQGLVHRCRAQSGAELEILESFPGFGEPPQPVILCMAVLKGDANRTVLDEAVQLGATDILFFHASRSEGRLREEKLAKLERIAITAIKQTGRARLPRITVYDSLTQALGQLPSGTVQFLAHPFDTEAGDGNASRLAAPAALVVGPEGGLTPAEVELALRAGCVPLRLAARRLRAETAASAGLAYLLSRLGECRPAE